MHPIPLPQNDLRAQQGRGGRARMNWFRANTC